MAGRSGAAAVMALDSGKIVATYHPESLAHRVALPGSAIKPFVLLQLLRSGKVTPSSEFVCRRRVQVGAHNLDCQHVRTVEAMNAERALAYSCNSYFTEMGSKLTGTELMESLRRAGFGAPTRKMPNDDAGALRLPATPEDARMAAVGESSIGVTPLQMLMAYAQLARNANAKDEAMQTVIAGLRGAVSYGTAQGAQVPGVEVAGKTGTSTAEHDTWTHAWFAGFAPASQPRVVIVVFLERGHGSTAADIAGRVLQPITRASVGTGR